MARAGRNYIHGDVEYRGRIVETGTRMTSETVYDETDAEKDARIAAWLAANPRRDLWSMPDRWRKHHREDRGLMPYSSDRTFGPYATVGPARAAAGTGRGQSRRVETGERADGGTYHRVREVEIGRVMWSPLEDE